MQGTPVPRCRIPADRRARVFELGPTYFLSLLLSLLLFLLLLLVWLLLRLLLRLRLLATERGSPSWPYSSSANQSADAAR